MFAECGKGYACVSVADGRLFTSGGFGDDEYVLALDLNGKLLWRTPSGKAWQVAQPGARATPTYRDGSVYHWNAHDDLVIGPGAELVGLGRGGESSQEEGEEQGKARKRGTPSAE